MKKKIRILSLCFVLLAAVTVFAVTPFAFAEDEAVTIYQNGVAVSEAVGLQDGADTVLNAVAVVADDVAPTYQWQVLADAETDSWFDLEGQSTDTIALNAAVLDEYFNNGIATIRCKASADGTNDYFSKKLAVSEAPATGVQPSASDDAAAAEDTAADATGETAPDTTESFIPSTVVFTDAGPFEGPVSVINTQMAKVKSTSAKTSDVDNTDGLNLSKKVTKNDDGTYKITMESYTTGTTVTTTKTIPVDIVLVLDQSGSMAYDFNGDSTNTNEDRRQYAMKEAVNQFIDAVNAKYSDDADHRISIVTFGSDASTLQNWTTVDSAGKTALQNKINGLPDSPSGATNASAGMQTAETLMGGGYSYTGSNANRQKVVVFFTDGIPTTQSSFNITVADNAIKSAKNLKDAGVTVYSVGIFNGANPEELYGASGFNQNSNGSVGSTWYTRSGLISGDAENYEIPAGNRFLNFLSNNFINASNIGLKEYSDFKVLYTNKGFTITENFDRTKTGYYLSANDSDSLNDIFQNISQQINTPSIELGSEAVVKDVISDYFELPDGYSASDIKIYTAEANKSTLDDPTAVNAWSEKVDSGLTASINGKTVSVSGFNYNENFVSKDGRGDKNDFYGKKLIIEFNVKIRDGFLGGNNVPTNGAAGLYETGTDQTPVKYFEQPTVDIPIPEIYVSAKDKYIYLTQIPSNEALLEGSSIMCGDVDLNNPNIEAWQIAFVDITTSTSFTDNNYAATADGRYSVTATVSPKDTNGSSKAQTGEATSQIKVFKPVITWRDSRIDIGDTANYTDNFVNVVWKHGDDVDDDVRAQVDAYIVGNAPSLTYEYSRAAGAFTEDTPVKVTAVKIGSTNILQYLTGDYAMTRDACNYKSPCQISDGNNFIVHVRKASVTVNYYLQNVDGNGYTKDTGRSYTAENQKIGSTYTEKPDTMIYPDIAGFEYNESNSSYSGEVTEEGLVLNLHYDRLRYPYEFRFLEQDTDTVLANPVTGNALFEASVTESAKDIFGYELVGDSSQTIKIDIEDSDNTAVKNVKTFYYVEKTVNINYVAVGPSGEDFGSVTPTSETVKIFNGNASGSTATAKDRYRFVGWFTDPDCTQTVTGDWIDGNKITPKKTVLEGSDKEGYVAATYYAKFERNVADLTITKDGWNNIDENQSFVFNVKGNDANTNAIDVDVVISFNDDIVKNGVTVSDLPVGNYIVTEKSGWSWRYAIGSVKFNQSALTPTDNGYVITLESNGGEIAFTNNRTNTGWLNGGNFAKNLFDGNSQGVFGVDVSTR